MHHCGQQAYPLHAVSILKAAQAKGAMAVNFNWGEYVIWHLGPNVRVSVDGRRETVYSEKRYQAAMDFMYGINEWDSIIRSNEVTMALVANKSSIHNLMNTQDGWELAYQDSISSLFLRRNSELSAKIGTILPSTSTPSSKTECPCFP
jgi:hypothetical protein